MKIKDFIIACLVLIVSAVFSCREETAKEEVAVEKNQINSNPKDNEKEFIELMKKHLDAVSNKDIESLASTMSPNLNMQLILPQTEIIEGVEAFLDYHKEWFKDTTWTFTTKILNVEVDRNIGMAITEVLYQEPERDGKPYYNRMTVSYLLKKYDDKWYVIKDHASSVEKSTEKQ